MHGVMRRCADVINVLHGASGMMGHALDPTANASEQMKTADIFVSRCRSLQRLCRVLKHSVLFPFSYIPFVLLSFCPFMLYFVSSLFRPFTRSSFLIAVNVTWW
jgi:hypothetical protein